MKQAQRKKRKLTEAEIDALVTAQADDDAAWDAPVHVRRNANAQISIPADLIVRASFIARLHRQKNSQAWLRQIIQERIELEEAAFLGAKREWLLKHSE